MADPFVSAVGTDSLHPSLSISPELPVDFFEPLVADFLQDEKYIKWAVGYRPWQLHCYGSPGCGKSTFAAHVVEDLKQRHTGKDIFVAYVHIKERLRTHHTGFVEDFLSCIYRQICSHPAHEYERARETGTSSSERIKLIRTALHRKLIQNEHNFLIFDGYDTLDMTACLLIDRELEHPGVANLSLLITRRNPPYRQPEHLRIGCNNCGKDWLELYWECQVCGDDGPQYCCDCKETSVCTDQEHQLALAEPYDRVEMRLEGSHVAITAFVASELTNVPHLGEEAVEHLSSDIATRVCGNINLAKLRIDDLLQSDNSDDNQALRDRLPRSIVAFFDSEIDQLLRDNDVDRDLGLMAIAAAAEYEDASGYGIRAVDLERMMRRAILDSPDLARQGTRSLEDIIMASNGMLVVQPPEELYVACFHPMFKLYVREDYNHHLHSAKLKLCPDEPSSYTQGSLSWNLGPSTTSPPTISAAFDTNDYVGVRGSSQDSAYYSRSSTLDTELRSHTGLPGATEPKGLFEQARTLAPQSRVTQVPVEANEAKEPSTRLCSFCRTHLLDKTARSGNHHQSLTAIEDSLRAKCMICTDLYGSLVDGGSMKRTSLSSEGRDCLYTWAVRSAGRSRSYDPSLQIIFTPISETNSLLQQNLPIRKYHILSEADAQVVPEQTLPPSTDPALFGGGLQIREWMKVCAETHTNCRSHQNTTWVPTRLVDLEFGSQDMVRIVDTAREGIMEPYLTLSHSWGPPTFLQLKRSNEKVLMGQGVQTSDLTINFQQAISVARFIGIRYIWIDSICIVQGSDGDFKTEGELMHDVYRHSYCNIVVADSWDSKGGLFRERNPANIVPVKIKSDGSGRLGRGDWRVVRDDTWNNELLSTKIYTRGWVFQERMLAPRILHFAKSQIFWDCSTLSACETFPHGLPHALDARASTDRHWRGRMQSASSGQSGDHQTLVGEDDDSIETFWRAAVLNYTSCNLTNQGDKSVAIWSIAKLVRDILGEKYAAGLWEANLEEQLAWHVRDPAPVGLGRIHELQHLYPSWTWASIKGPIIAHNRLARARHYVVTDHAENAISFKSRYEEEKYEPKLIRVPMDLLGYLAQGTLSQTSGSYCLKLELPGDAQHLSATNFNVLLDEVPADGSNFTKATYSFVVLAASAVSADGSRPGLTLHQRSSGNSAWPRNQSDAQIAAPKQEAKPSPVTYSGVGLLLEPVAAYKPRQDEALAILEEEISSCPDESWTKAPYGCKSLKDKREDLRLLTGTLNKLLHYVEEQKCSKQSLFRRIGAVKFHNLDERVWEAIAEDGKHKIWLD